MRQKFARLTDIDSYLGGADTYRLYLIELAKTEQILSRSSYSVTVGRSLTELAATQAQQTGWAAFDAGFVPAAIELFDYSHRAASQASSAELAANAFVHIAYATSDNESIAAADHACVEIGSGAQAKARALLQSRRAWSLATAGDGEGAARALDDARDALEERVSESPHWCAWMNHMELDIMTGRVWSVLHRPDRAIAPLERVLSGYPDKWARDKSLYMTWLADAYLDDGQHERAVSTASTAFTLAEPVASARPLARLRQVAQRCVAAAADGSTELAGRVAAACAPIPAQL